MGFREKKPQNENLGRFLDKSHKREKQLKRLQELQEVVKF